MILPLGDNKNNAIINLFKIKYIVSWWWTDFKCLIKFLNFIHFKIRSKLFEPFINMEISWIKRFKAQWFLWIVIQTFSHSKVSAHFKYVRAKISCVIFSPKIGDYRFSRSSIYGFYFIISLLNWNIDKKNIYIYLH